MTDPMQDQVDRAREWIGEHFPDLDGVAYEAKLEEVLHHLGELDAAVDEAEARLAGGAS